MNPISIAALHKIFLSSRGVCTDTRTIQTGEIFFCLKGDNFNANQFAKRALEMGALYVIIDEEQFYIDEHTILVPDVLEYLQQLAAFHRRRFNIPVIGITGTNGKTTTKEMLKTVLSTHFKVHATLGNLNNHIGVPLTLLSMPQDTDIAIIEMGANHLGEIADLCKISDPSYGIVTSIGRAHLEGFGSIENIIETKTALYRHVDNNAGKVFVNADDDLLMKLSEGLDRYTYGRNPQANLIAQSMDQEVFAGVVWNQMQIKSQLVGSFNFPNLMAALAVGDYFQLTPEQMANAIQNYAPSNKRSQLQKTDKNTLVVDAYNANPSSMEVAIEAFRGLQHSNKWLILGDMRELGDESEHEHRQLINRLSGFDSQKIILVGPQLHRLAGHNQLLTFENVDEAKKYLQQQPITEAMILLKASRAIALEQLLPLL